MSVDLIRDMINYEKFIGEGTGQTMVSGDIVIPDRNPDIEKVLCIDGRAYVVSSQATQDRIIVEGKMVFEILYCPSEGEKVFSISASSAFNQNIQVPGSADKMLCRVNAAVEHIGYELITGRKLKVSAVINLNGAAVDRDKTEVVVDMKGEDVQTLKSTIDADQFTGEGANQVIAKGRIDILEDNGSIKSILKNSVDIHKKDISVQEGKVVINACILTKTLYQLEESSELNYVEQDVPFVSEINIENARPDMKCDVDFKIIDCYSEIKENDAGEKKAIENEVVVDSRAVLYERVQLQNILDAYSAGGRFDFEKQDVKGMSFFNEGVSSQDIKETLSIPSEMPGAAYIRHVNVKPIVTETKIVEDKIIVEGVISCCAIYTAAVEEGGLLSFQEEVPFKSAIDMPGVKIDMIPYVFAGIQNVTYEKASQREIEIKANIECCAKIYKKYIMDIVSNIEEVEIPDEVKDMPSLIIYIVQPSDTLWKIAKKYYTSIEDIISLNDIEDADNITPGMKLLIPKKNFMKG